MRNGKRNSRKGFSVVVSSMILTSAVLVITLIAQFVATSILAQQSQNQEFDEMKNNIMLFSEVVEDVATKPGTSGYLRLNLITAKPSFTLSKTVSVSVDPIGTVLQGKTRILEIQGGSRISVTGQQTIAGSEGYILTSLSSRLGRAYTNQSRGAWVVMDFLRIRVTYHGSFYFYDTGDGTSGYLNVVEISFINMSFGTIAGGSGVLNMKAQNMKLNVFSYKTLSNSLTINFLIDGQTKDTYGFTGSPSAVGTIVNVVRSDVRVFTV